MDEAAPQAASGDAVDRVAVSQQLQALRLAWGDTYLIGFEQGHGYYATRHHQPGKEVVKADDPVELGNLLADDFEAGRS